VTIEQSKAKRTPNEATTKKSPKLKEQKSQEIVKPVLAAPSPQK